MTEISYSTALAIDLLTLCAAIFVATRCTRSLLHPCVMMLGAHAYIVTLRLSQLARGYSPMAYSFTWPISSAEIVQASLASDLALVAIALGWVLVGFWGRRGKPLPSPVRVMLSDQRLLFSAAFALFMAIASICIVGPHPLREVTGDHSSSTSGYLLASVGWAGWCFCLLHYRYGFPWYLLLGTAVTLLTFMLLSTFRGAIIIPCVFLLFTWLARRVPRTLPLGVLPAVICLWLVWLPMKPIVYAIQAGQSVGDAVMTGVGTVFTNFGQDNGSGIDFQFLDMVASTMTLVDVHGSYFYGSTISPLLVSPYPRQLWPEKPELNQYQQDLDIPSRAMAKLHMTAGLVGESYANFGYFGVVLIPFGISVCLAAAYRRLASSPLLTPGVLLYLLYLSTYMQLYRDGLVSAVFFPFVHCAPVGWLAVSHWLVPPRQRRTAGPRTVPDLTSFPEWAQFDPRMHL